VKNLWPYIPDNDEIAPPHNCHKDAEKHKITGILYVDESSPKALHSGLKEAISHHHFGVIVGIQIYDAFESNEVAKTGYIPMPKKNEKCAGGHEVLIVGYDDEEEYYELLNSWGSDWGDQGFFYLPYDYMHDPNLASEFRSITGVDLE